MIKNQWIILMILAILPGLVNAQEITLQQYLLKVKTNHPFFNKEQLSAGIEHEQQKRFLGDQDWVVTANPRFSHEERGDKASTFVPREDEQFRFNSGIERVYWRNGGRISIGYDYNRSNQTFAAPFGSQDLHGNGVNVNYSIPLMKNSSGILSRLGYELQGYSIDLIEVTSLENQENFLADTGARFIDWALLTEQRNISKNRLLLAENELATTKKKHRTNLAAEVDVLRAEDAVFNAKQNLMQFESQYKALRAELSVRAGDTILINSEPDVDLYTFKELATIKQARSELQTQSRLLKLLDLKLAQLTHEQRGLSDESRPELNLTVSGGLRGEDVQFSGSMSLDQPQYSVALAFRYPLGQTTNKADISKARIEKMQLAAERASTFVQLEAQLQNLLIQIKELEKIMALNQQQINVAQQKTLQELRRHNQGRNELTFVIQSRDNEQFVKLIYAQNAATYQKLYLEYLSLTDQLITDADQKQ